MLLHCLIRHPHQRNKGSLALPYALSESGILWGGIQIFLCVMLGYYTNLLLVKLTRSEESDIFHSQVKASDFAKQFSYIEIARILYGPKFEFGVKILYFVNLWCGNVLAIILV